MSLEAIPLPPPQPMIPDGDFTIAIATLGNGEEKDSHQMLMEELKSFSSGNKKLRPVGVVNPRSRGQTETVKSTAAPAHSPAKQSRIKAESKPKQNNPVISTTKPSRKKVVKWEESEDESSSEDDGNESGESSQIQDLSKLISGLQQQLNLMATKTKTKNKRKPEIVHVDSNDSSNTEPEPEPTAEPQTETFETAATIPSPKPVEHPTDTSVEEEPCILHAPVSPKTPKDEASESPAVSPPSKDEILQRRASLRPKSSASFNFKTTPSPLRRKQEEESSPETPKYESFVEDFKNFSFKRKVVTNAHRKSSESSESHPVVNERILNKVEESAHPTSKKVFSGRPSSAANEIEKKKVDAIPVTKPATPLKKETKKEKIIKPKLKVKLDIAEKVEPQAGKRNRENGIEEESSPAFTLDWLIASISPDELLKLQQQLKGKMKNKTFKQASKEERATYSAPAPPPPPPISTNASQLPEVEANGGRSLLFQQIKSFSKAKLRSAGCQSNQQPSPSSSKSTQQPNPSANSETLKDALLRRFAALNSDEDEESDDDEVSSDSEESDTDEDWSEN